MTPCLEFTGRKDKNGYGRIWINNKYVFAHRFAYCVANGLLLNAINGLVIRHACDNPSCILPAHLCAGSNQENANDMVSRKRQAYGARNSNAKLTEKDVREILRIYIPRDKDFGAIALAKIFNVSRGHIARICRGEKWSHIKK